MSTWKDRNGKDHKIEIDIPTAQRLRDECDIDLLACLNDPKSIEPLFAALSSNVTLPIELLSVIEDTQEPENFGRLFNGEALESAANALTEAIIGFFREPQKSILRKLYTKAIAASDQITSEAVQEATEAIDSPEFSTGLLSLLMDGNGLKESLESSATTEQG